MTWQPIKTAPKNDKLVLLWARELGLTPKQPMGITIGMYDPDFKNTGSTLGGENYTGWRTIIGWGDEYSMVYPDLVPTHWMPLPDPPKDTK